MKKYIYILLLLISLITFTSCKDKTYTIKLEGLDGLNLDIPTSYIAKKGEVITLPTLEDEYVIYTDSKTYNNISDCVNVKLTKTEYYFNDWVVSGNSISNTYEVSSDATITASFVTNCESMTINFNLNGGSIEYNDIYTIDGSQIKLGNPTLEHNIFYGWCKSITLNGNVIDSIGFKNNSTSNIYAVIKSDPEYVNELLNKIPDEVTTLDIDNIELCRQYYDNMYESELSKINNYQKLVQAESKLDDLKDAIEIINDIKNYNLNNVIASDYYDIIKIYNKYDKLEKDIQGQVYNYEALNSLKDTTEKLYNDNIDAAKEFDKTVLVIPAYAEKNFSAEIANAQTAYNNLNENEKSLVTTKEKLDLLVNNLLTIDNAKNITYITKTSTNKYIYDSKDILFKGFFTDYYFYIKAYHGLDELNKSGLISLEEFITCASSFTYGKYSNMTAIGHLAGQYLLQKDINGIKENQPETKYIGFCTKNNVYGELLDFFFNFFAYWRIDEKYADLSNYGADMFAESWAPTVDWGKFFGYDIDTCYVKTARMQDCYLHTSNCVTNWEDIYNIQLRGYVFEGWYDNPEFSGNKITDLKGYNVVYAKWSVDQDQVDADQANKVINYIYNLTTSKAIVNCETIGYVRAMYNDLSNNAKTLVTNYNTLVQLEEKCDA